MIQFLKELFDFKKNSYYHVITRAAGSMYIVAIIVLLHFFSDALKIFDIDRIILLLFTAIIETIAVYAIAHISRNNVNPCAH